MGDFPELIPWFVHSNTKQNLTIVQNGFFESK